MSRHVPFVEGRALLYLRSDKGRIGHILSTGDVTMNFESYLDKAWNEHATDPSGVAKSFADGIALLSTPAEVASLAHLIAHVFGEHLGQWDAGDAMLSRLLENPLARQSAETMGALKRFRAVLKLASGQTAEVTEFSKSEQIRIFALVASALVNHSKSDLAQTYFSRALELANMGLSQDDPANRTLAAMGNNIACALEEKVSRTPADVKLMILAAEVARRFWEVAGGPSEVSMAEYRLANTFMKAQDLKRALEHAQLTVEVVVENSLTPLDRFYAYEVLARVERMRESQTGLEAARLNLAQSFETLSVDEKSRTEKTFKELMGQ